jgi:hypothetical protein
MFESHWINARIEDRSGQLSGMRIGLPVLRWDTHPSSFHEYWPYQILKTRPASPY